MPNNPPLRPIDLLVLLSLVRGDRHGYGIRLDLIEMTDGEVQLDAGNLYRYLNRLLRHGMVERVGPRPDDESQDPRRRNYHLTELGQMAATNELERLESLLDSEPSRRLLAAARP